MVRLLHQSVGFPEYGVDIDETHMILEIKTPIAYQRNKGCYPGQEVVERILAYGKGKTPKTICTLSAEGQIDITTPSYLFAVSGSKAGVISSAAYDSSENKTYALACLTHKYAEGFNHFKVDKERVVLF